MELDTAFLQDLVNQLCMAIEDSNEKNTEAIREQTEAIKEITSAVVTLAAEVSNK